MKPTDNKLLQVQICFQCSWCGYNTKEYVLCIISLYACYNPATLISKLVQIYTGIFYKKKMKVRLWECESSHCETNKKVSQLIITGCLSPLVLLRQVRHAAMSRARQASLSLRSLTKLSSAEPRNRSFSLASQPDGQNQHMARREHTAWAGVWSRAKSSIKVVR